MARGTAAGEIGQHLVHQCVAQTHFGIGQRQSVRAIDHLNVFQIVTTLRIDRNCFCRISNTEILDDQIRVCRGCVEVECVCRIVGAARISRRA